jgi:hypothetical protein
MSQDSSTNDRIKFRNRGESRTKTVARKPSSLMQESHEAKSSPKTTHGVRVRVVSIWRDPTTRPRRVGRGVTLGRCRFRRTGEQIPTSTAAFHSDSSSSAADSSFPPASPRRRLLDRLAPPGVCFFNIATSLTRLS